MREPERPDVAQPGKAGRHMACRSESQRMDRMAMAEARLVQALREEELALPAAEPPHWALPPLLGLYQAAPAD